MNKHRSFWLEEVAGDAPDAPPLEGSSRAEVAIIGGGFVGLWTAIRLKEMEPACDVALLEQDICGAGASGRNGGFLLSWWPKLASLTKLTRFKSAASPSRRSTRLTNFANNGALTPTSAAGAGSGPLPAAPN
jgi:glycine/D-amino acid oxidase-like deaminating enzyme